MGPAQVWQLTHSPISYLPLSPPCPNVVPVSLFSTGRCATRRRMTSNYADEPRCRITDRLIQRPLQHPKTCRDIPRPSFMLTRPQGGTFSGCPSLAFMHHSIAS